MVWTMFVRHFIHIFSNDIMSFPNIQNQHQHPFRPKEPHTRNAPIIGIRIRRPMTNPKKPIPPISFPKLSHKIKKKRQTHASKCPHLTAACPHSKQLFWFLSLHSKSIAKNVLSLLSHSSWMALGSPVRTRVFNAARTAAGSVECSFL